MSPDELRRLAALERRHCWHPFTQMRDWMAGDPLFLVDGQGAMLRDAAGREYLDGNSSIWTNLHGHRHPKIDRAIREQLDRVAHTSFLGFTHPPAAELAAELAALMPALPRVFFSDDGSTAIEVALKMAIQYWQQSGQSKRTRLLAFDHAYHGDTMGASSLGGIPIFHDRFGAWQFPVTRLAGPEDLGRADLDPETVAAAVIEPLVQGAAGIRLWPPGTLRALRDWCDRSGALLILDEVLTGFGRTGTMFACQQEQVTPDFLCLAKGLTGGYLPMAATLTSEKIFGAFLGDYAELKAFSYGHSYTANPLGCAAARANLAIFHEERTLENLQPKIAALRDLLADLASEPAVREVRQCGFIAGIEVGDPAGAPGDWREQRGARVCLAARKHGLLTRPIRDTVVLIPPLCTALDQLEQAVGALRSAIRLVSESVIR